MFLIRPQATSHRPTRAPWIACLLGLSMLLASGGGLAQSTQRQGATDSTSANDAALQPAGPVRLRLSTGTNGASGEDTDLLSPGPRQQQTPPLPAYQPSEFERYVQQQAGPAPANPTDARRQDTQGGFSLNQPLLQDIRRFGSDLVTDTAPGQPRAEPLPAVPADYLIKPGDEVLLTLWGSVDADLRLPVDRNGRITVPRIGTIQVAGVRHADLADTINRRVGQVFRGYQLSATLGQLRPVRVFVTGFAQRPGSLTVSSLSSVLHVLMRSGGPSAAGSFRDIQLIRAGQTVARFDLYTLLLSGDRRADQIIQPDDVVHIGPAGPQIGVIGSVNQQAVFELRPGETLTDVLRMAGGFNAVADRSRVAIERLADRTNGRVSELALPQGGSLVLGSGDLVRVFSAISAVLPKDKQKMRVRVEGEVARPGDYVLPPGSSIGDAIRAAGGLSPAAYVFGTEFSRESVRQTQQDNYDRALRDLETDMAKNQAGRRSSSAEEAANQNNNVQANARLIERLRQVRPTGRVVLQLPPDATQLPDLALDDGDRLLIPSRSTAVGVFGSVFNSGSFVWESGRTAADYLRQAGGPTRGADKESMFLIRANGAVVSARQGASFWGSDNSFIAAAVLPGDTVFVPEELDKSTFTQNAKDWTQILYQFGLGLAGIKSLGL